MRLSFSSRRGVSGARTRTGPIYALAALALPQNRFTDDLKIVLHRFPFIILLLPSIELPSPIVFYVYLSAFLPPTRPCYFSPGFEIFSSDVSSDRIHVALHLSASTRITKALGVRCSPSLFFRSPFSRQLFSSLQLFCGP